MLSGNWKNIDDLEEHLSYPEVYIIVQAMRSREHRQMKFMAAIQGIDLDGEKKQEEDPVERAKRRIRAKQAGRSEDEQKFHENIAQAGFGYRKT